MRGALQAEVKFGTYFGVSVPAQECWNTSYGESDLGFVPTQVPPEPGDPDGEQDSGHCLMKPPT